MKKMLVIVITIVLSVILFIIPMLKRSSIRTIEKNKEKQIMKSIEEHKQKKIELEKEIEEISSSENVERFAREKLNMSDKGERVYKFVEEGK